MCFFLLKVSYLGWSSYNQEALYEAGVFIGTQNGKQCGVQLCYMGFGWCLCPLFSLERCRPLGLSMYTTGLLHTAA